MTEPIRPEDVAAQKQASLPEGVIEAFNDLIAKAFNGHSAIVYQDDAVEAILERCPGVLSRQQVFDDHLLDVEPVYRTFGWMVVYDKPGWNETYKPNFLFTPLSKQ